MNDSKNNILDKISLSAGLAVICFGIIIRFLWLEIDPPIYFSGISQDLLTDPYNFIHYARNKVLFGAWDIFDFPRWITFKYSLVSMLSYILFEIGGVSRLMTNLASMILNLSGLFFFVYGMRKFSKRVSFITAVILSINMFLIVFGRYPFLENGLIFLCGAIFLIWSKWGTNRYGIIICGILASLAILSGKLFGIVIIFPLILSLYYTGENKLNHSILMISSFIGSLILFGIFFYGTNINIFTSYFLEQTVGMYDSPISLSSPVTFIEKMITFGSQARQVYFNPFLIIMAGLSVLALTLTSNFKEIIENDRSLLFNLTWLICGAGLLMMFNYRPLRYQLFLILPIAGIIGTLFCNIGILKFDKRPSFLKILISLILLWYIFFHLFLLYYLHYYEKLPSPHTVWYSLFPALLLSSVFIAIPRLLNVFRHLRFILYGTIMIYVVIQSFWIVDWMNNRHYNMKEASIDLAGVISNDAVIVGPYSSALTIDNNIRSFVYMFGLSNKEDSLFTQYPITHIATDVSNWEDAVKDFPELEKSEKLTHYWLRDVEVSIIRSSIENHHNNNYQETLYEKAIGFKSESPTHDSLIYYLNAAQMKYRKNKSILLQTAYYYLAVGKPAVAMNAFDRLIAYYPDDFSAYYEKGKALYVLSILRNNSVAARKSEKMFRKAIELNPVADVDIEATRQYYNNILKKAP